MTDHTHNPDARGVTPQGIFVTRDYLIHTIAVLESRSDIVWKIEANTASKYQLLDSELKYGSVGSERRLSWAVRSIFCFAVTAWRVVCG